MLIYDKHSATLRHVSDELYHWKYIKRERKNGRWVYYYDQSELDFQKRQLDKANTHAHITQRRATAAKNVLDKSNEIRFKKHGDPVNWPVEDSVDNARQTDVWQNHVAANKAAKARVSVLTERYKKAKTKSLPARTISKGLVAIANFASRVFRKKR